MKKAKYFVPRQIRARSHFFTADIAY